MDNKKTRLIIIILAAIVIIGFAVLVIVTATMPDANRLIYTIKDDGTLEVTEIKNTYKDGWFCKKELTVPEKVDDKTVTSIKRLDSAKLQKIVLPDSVTEIQDEAFSACASLKDINLGNSITSIGDLAFQDCKSLHKIAIPQSIQQIGANVFQNTPIDFNTDNGLNYVGNEENPFLVLIGTSNTSLTDVDVHKDTKIVAKAAFEVQKSEKSSIITVNTANITVLPERVFTNCAGLRQATLTAVTKIGAGCFEKCSNLTDVVFGDNLTHLASRCFAEAGLTELILPNSVTYFAEDAIKGSGKLATLVLNNSTYVSAYNILYKKDKSDIVAVAEGITEATILSDFDIGSGATTSKSQYIDKLSSHLASCKKLQRISIENGATITSNETVRSVEHTYTYFVDNNVLYKSDKYIDKDKREHVDTTLQSIPQMIESIVLSDKLTSIPQSAFANCINLKSFSIGNGENISLTKTDSSKTEHNYIYFVEHDILYQTDKYTKNDKLYEETSLYVIPKMIENVVLSDKLTSIPKNAFVNCINLKNITIGKNVTEIEGGAFAGLNVSEEKPLTITFADPEGWYVEGKLISADVLANNDETVRLLTVDDLDKKWTKSKS